MFSTIFFVIPVKSILSWMSPCHFESISPKDVMNSYTSQRHCQFGRWLDKKDRKLYSSPRRVITRYQPREQWLGTLVHAPRNDKLTIFTSSLSFREARPLFLIPEGSSQAPFRRACVLLRAGSVNKDTGFSLSRTRVTPDTSRDARRWLPSH